MRNKNVLIFCESYVQLENSLKALELHKDHNVTIVVGLMALYELFCNVVRKKYKFIIVKLFDDKIHCGNQSSNGLSRLLRIYRMRFLVIPSVIKSLALTRFDLIYIFTFTFNWPTYHVLNAVSLKCDTIYVHSKDYSFEPTEESITKYSALNVIYKKLAMIAFGNGIDLIRFQNGTITSNFEPHMVGKLKAYIGPSERSEWLDGYSSKNFFSIDKKYKVIYFDAGISVNEWFENPNSATHFIFNILNILREHYSADAIGIKYHPSTPPGAVLDNYGDILENYVPADWYCNEGTMLIGIFTSAVYFSKYGRRILLYEAVNWKKESQHLDFMRNCIRSRALDAHNIYTPKTMAEYKDILNIA